MCKFRNSCSSRPCFSDFGSSNACNCLIPSANSFPLRKIPTWRHITSRIFASVAQHGDGFDVDFDAAFGGSFCVAEEFPGNGAGLPGSAAPLRFPTGASFISACPARAPNTNPSSRELLANRLAPCTPVAAVSPAAYNPGSEVRPHRSVFTPPIM